MGSVGLGCPILGGVVVVMGHCGAWVGVRSIGETTPFLLWASARRFCWVESASVIAASHKW